MRGFDMSVITASFDQRFIQQLVGNAMISNPRVAIIELIANAWDAGATEIHILWPTVQTENVFSLRDNGIGMSSASFTKRFMKISYNRQEEQGKDVEFPAGVTVGKRRAFGKNGIGRLSAFCFADKYYVSSTQDGIDRFTYEITQGSGADPIKAKKVENSDYSAVTRGTVIFTKEFKSRSLDIQDLRKEIGMRFISDPNFVIFVNGEKINLLDIPSINVRNFSAQVEGISPIEITAIDTARPDGKPNTLLIDSKQLESGEALDNDFRQAAALEIEQFKREMKQRSGAGEIGEVSDSDLLREVMNTVGKKGRLGEQIRCVVSVSMLTEGWDTNTVTHILGVRAFGTQLLCEQVVGRGLRRYSYELNDEGIFNVEYADIMGIPFDFTAKPQVAPVKPPRKTERVKAMKERAALEIVFPRVVGYRVDLPEERLTANFTADSTLVLTPELVGPGQTLLEGIVGEGITLTVAEMKEKRPSTVSFELAKHLLYTYFRDTDQEPKLHLFGQLKRIVRQWIDGGHLECKGGTGPWMLQYLEIANQASERIYNAIAGAIGDEKRILAVLDPYNPKGSSTHVGFQTTRDLWTTDPLKSHINYVVCDSEWEAEFARVAEKHERVISYVKNQGLGLEVPYKDGSTARMYPLRSVPVSKRIKCARPGEVPRLSPAHKTPVRFGARPSKLTRLCAPPIKTGWPAPSKKPPPTCTAIFSAVKMSKINPSSVPISSGAPKSTVTLICLSSLINGMPTFSPNKSSPASVRRKTPSGKIKSAVSKSKAKSKFSSKPIGTGSSVVRSPSSCVISLKS